MIKTVKIPVVIPEDRHQDLFQTFNIIRDIFNIHTTWAWTNQTYNKGRAHTDLYHELRKTFPTLPSQYVQSTRDQALEAVKRAFNQIERDKKTKSKRIKKEIKRPEKRLYSGIRIDRCTGSYRPVSSIFTFSCVGKRIKLVLPKPLYFKEVMEQGFFQAATISYNSRTKTFWLSLNFKLPDLEIKSLEDESKIVGIDLGIYNIVTLSDGSIVKHNKVREIKRRRQYLRGKLQTKGTSSSKKKLKSLSGKEARFSRNENHVLSKQIVQSDYDVFVFEDLKSIRNSHKKYHKKSNRMLSNWTFGQLVEFTTYKAQALGKHVVKVNPMFTSQRCSCCGTVEKSNRNKSKYKCNKCSYELHADVNAANNIRNIFLSTDWQSDKQGFVKNPNVTTSQLES